MIHTLADLPQHVLYPLHNTVRDPLCITANPLFPLAFTAEKRGQTSAVPPSTGLPQAFQSDAPAYFSSAKYLMVRTIWLV